MKSEHRHELRTNELGRIAESVRPVLERNATWIVIAVVGAAAIAASAVVLINMTGAANTAGWSDFAVSRTAEDYANVADTYDDTAVAAWARLEESERHLQNGLRLMFTDRAAALSDLGQAQKNLELLLSRKNISTELRESALFQLARCLEATSDGKTDAAIEAYERLLREFPNSTYKAVAEQRIAVLRTDRAKDFYAWFHEQKPKPPDREPPRDGASDGGAASVGSPEKADGEGATPDAAKKTPAANAPSDEAVGPELNPAQPARPLETSPANPPTAEAPKDGAPEPSQPPPASK
jgi:tetratricopeptide (TPR) repeat protein